MSWHVAAALLQLEKEAGEKRGVPFGKHAYDGAIGDASHQARKSDHNPDYSHNGVVRAIDIGTDGFEGFGRFLLNQLIGDPRVWYVIHRGIIYSRTHGWRALKYTGANGHYHHVHVSLQGANGISYAAADKIEHDTRVWFDSAKPRTKKTIYYDQILQQFQISAGEKPGKLSKKGGVMVVQANLNRHVGTHLKVDGYAGENTLRAWERWERRTGVARRPRVPNDKEAIQKLVNGYAVVK